MAQRERLLSRIKFYSCAISIALCLCCIQNQKEETISVSEFIDTSQIPMDTISSFDSTLKLVNGLYYYKGKPFSGFIRETYENDSLKSIGSYYQGMQHGMTKTFYPT